MNNQRTIRFFPLPVVWLGIATWLILTFAACHADIVANDYKLPVIVFGIAITALSMAFVAGWASLLLALVVNWSASGRRSIFRARRCLNVPHSLVSLRLLQSWQYSTWIPSAFGTMYQDSFVRLDATKRKPATSWLAACGAKSFPKRPLFLCGRRNLSR